MASFMSKAHLPLISFDAVSPQCL